MKGIVEGIGGVKDDAAEVVGSWLDEVEGGDVGDGLAVLVDEEVKSDAVLAEVLDVDEGRKDVLAEAIVDQDLVDLLVVAGAGAGAGIQRLVQIQHAENAVGLLLPKIQCHIFSKQSDDQRPTRIFSPSLSVSFFLFPFFCCVIRYYEDLIRQRERERSGGE